MTDELASLEASLENLRSAAAAAKDDLLKSQEKLLDIHNVLGSNLPKEWEDISSDLTESRRQAFHDQVQEMEELEKARTKAVIQLLLDCQNLLTELKLDTAFKNDCIKRDSSSIESIHSEQANFDHQIMASLIDHDDGTHSIHSRVESSTDTGISASVLDRLTKRLAELSQEKRRRKKYLGELGQGIASLWEKLRVSEEEQRSFSDSVQGLGIDTIEQGERELQRLTDLKAQMMGNLIKESREKIEDLCKETYTKQSQINCFEGGKVTDETLFTDDLLLEHEEFIQCLQEKADQMRPLFKYIEKREIIIKERMEYEELQKDPERLQQRGAALTKQLMKEEKMSKRIKKDLPKYTELLSRKMKDWEQQHGDAFPYEGGSYLGRMENQEKEWQEYKNHEIKMKLKKKQRGMANEKAISNKSTFKPLPGKKRVS